MDREQWEMIKEFALFQGCPQNQVEDALVQFAADHAYNHAQRAMQGEEFRQWKQHKERKQETRRTSDIQQNQ